MRMMLAIPVMMTQATTQSHFRLGEVWSLWILIKSRISMGHH